MPFVVLSPWRKVPSSFLFERLLPPFAFHFSTPLAGVAFSDFRRISRSRCEGLCVTRTASLTSTRFAFQYPLSALTPASRINSQNGYQFNPPLHCHRSSLSSSLSRSSLAAPSLLQILGLVLGLLHRSWIVVVVVEWSHGVSCSLSRRVWPLVHAIWLPFREFFDGADRRPCYRNPRLLRGRAFPPAPSCGFVDYGFVDSVDP